MTTFLALLRRDIHVSLRNAPMLVLGILTQPVLVVLVFGNILPRLGLVAAEFRTVMVPGLMAITVMMAGVQGILIPLASDLGGDFVVLCERPIERLLGAREQLEQGARTARQHVVDETRCLLEHIGPNFRADRLDPEIFQP